MTIGTLLTDFLRLPTILALPVGAAGRLVSLYWLGAMIGRFTGAGLLKHLAPSRLLLGAAIMAMALGAVAVLGHGALAAIALVGVGLFNSVMYPTIYVLALPSEPSIATPGATMLYMAVVGGAVVPVLTGLAADRVGLQVALSTPVMCYGLVAFFAMTYPTIHARRR